MKFNRDKAKTRYGVESLHGAPHKPFLILSILQLIEEDEISSNFIELNSKLEAAFWELSRSVNIGRKRDILLPFFHMKSEPFWALQRNDGAPADFDSRPTSKENFHRIYSGAIIQSNLFERMVDKNERQKLKIEILKENFHPDIHQTILNKQIQIIESNNYATDILKFKPLKKLSKPSRSSGFRKAVNIAYEHTCVFTGTRLNSPEFMDFTDAAHIKPWRISHDDSISNGIALSKHCHWAFDQGLLAVSAGNEILVSKYVENYGVNVDIFLDLIGRELVHPTKESYLPDPENFKFHRQEIYQG